MILNHSKWNYSKIRPKAENKIQKYNCLISSVNNLNKGVCPLWLKLPGALLIIKNTYLIKLVGAWKIWIEIQMIFKHKEYSNLKINFLVRIIY